MHNCIGKCPGSPFNLESFHVVGPSRVVLHKLTLRPSAAAGPKFGPKKGRGPWTSPEKVGPLRMVRFAFV